MILALTYFSKKVKSGNIFLIEGILESPHLPPPSPFLHARSHLPHRACLLRQHLKNHRNLGRKLVRQNECNLLQTARGNAEC